MTDVALVFGGRSVEHRVSVRSARTVAQALDEAGHRVLPFAIARNGVWAEEASARRALAGELDEVPAASGPVAPSVAPLLASGAQVAFPIVHGTWGEDGTIQGLFEMLDLAYVGAGVAASAVAMDKGLAKQVLEAAGVPVVPARLAGRRELQEDREGTLARLAELPLPVFVKPSVGGSSVGIRRVERAVELAPAVEFALRFDDRVLVERAVAGRELECSVLGYRELTASRVGEIVPGREFYDYADKYLEDGARLDAPAQLEPETERRLQRLAVDAFAAIGGHGMGRVDFLLDPEAGPYVNEINTLPGFTTISMYPKLWAISGVPLPKLVDRLVQVAVERHADRHRLDAGIQEWLAGLGDD